jgi:hypothetical protein
MAAILAEKDARPVSLVTVGTDDHRVTFLIEDK